MANYERTFLWAIPRSLSTAVFRAMENRSDTKVVLEPYAKAYYFGEERVSRRYLDQADEPNAKFIDIFNELEELKNEECNVFVKDMAYYIWPLENRLSLIPKGYRHTFLLRNPSKAIKSLYLMSIKSDFTGWETFDQSEVGFKELWELYEFLSTQCEKPPIVLDADDLLKDPENYLRMYTSELGLEYESSMLSWDEPEKSVAYSSEWYPWFQDVLNSKTIYKSNPTCKKQTCIELPGFILDCMQENMVYYDKFSRVKANWND